MYGAIENGLDESVKFYEKWNEEVKRVVPKERLLIFNVKEGWKPLCDFLEVPVPAANQPFPHVNDTKEFQGIIKAFKIGGIFCVYILPLLFAALLYYFSESIASITPF